MTLKLSASKILACLRLAIDSCGLPSAVCKCHTPAFSYLENHVELSPSTCLGGNMFPLAALQVILWFFSIWSTVWRLGSTLTPCNYLPFARLFVLFCLQQVREGCFLKSWALSVSNINGKMAEEETLCDRTYRAHERQESKPDKLETRSLPRHTKQDHKVRW